LRVLLLISLVLTVAACSPTEPLTLEPTAEAPGPVIPLRDVRPCQPIAADTSEQSGYSRCADVAK
jgi:hypothetical protein